jgi:RNA polymerase sigma factor (sigma-70 family)
MQQHEDDIQIEKTLSGNTTAFAILIEKYQNMAFTLAYNILLNREDAEEATQDAFLKAFSSLQAFKREAKFSTWLYRIVVNTSINKGRKKKMSTITLEDVNSKADISFPSEDALAAYHLLDQQRFIQEALLALREDERLVITLYYLNELSTMEVAKVTHFSLSNVKVLLHRGRQKLAESITHILKQEAKSIL